MAWYLVIEKKCWCIFKLSWLKGLFKKRNKTEESNKTGKEKMIAETPKEIEEVEVEEGTPRLIDASTGETHKLGAFYGSMDIQWLVLKNRGGGKYIILKNETCREYTIKAYALRLCKGETDLEIGMLFVKDGKDWSEKERVARALDGLKTINMFEEHLDWEQKSELIPLEVDNKIANAFLLKPNPNWYRAPHTMSMLFLFLRTGYILIKNGMRCPCCIPDAIRKIEDSGDFKYYHVYHDKFLLFLRNLDFIYGDRERVRSFDISRLSGGTTEYSLGKEGISKLFSGTSQDVEVRDRFRELLNDVSRDDSSNEQ